MRQTQTAPYLNKSEAAAMAAKASRAAGSKKLIFLLAGIGSLFAVALIFLGIIFLVVGGAQPDPTLAPASVTATLGATATSPAGGLVVVPAATATATSPPPVAVEPQPSSPVDSVSRQATATRAPTATPDPATPTPSPVVRRQQVATLTQPVTVDGVIELVEPAHDIQVLPDLVNFRWRWQPNKNCQPPPDGYAFEIRVWRDVDNAAPMGAMNAQAEKQRITCDPATGIYSLAVGNLPSIPGTGGAKDGRFRWDVALVQLDPYQPVVTTNYRLFFYSK
ncbi:MAG TPA: hypothetical protein PKD98_03955 [Anaerolineae bacterium]|nr:hypothetical protein [Anaerolineae bacterium]